METTHPTPSPSTEPELDDVARTLEDAALYLEHHGWCQDHMYQPVSGSLPRACALGAINQVTHPQENDSNAACSHALAGTLCPSITVTNFLADFLDDGIYRDVDDTPVDVVWKFNDHPDSTVHLVTHALRAAAKRYRVLEDA